MNIREQNDYIIGMVKSIIILILVSLCISCSIPPEDTPRIPFLKSVESFLASEEEPASITDFFYSLRTLENTSDLISSMDAQDQIVFIGEVAEPNEDTLLYTVGGNRLRVHQSLFVTTSAGGKYFYSLDGTNWYSMKNEKRKGILNIDYSYPIESNYDNRSHILELRFKWTADKSNTADIVKMRKKVMVSLDRNMAFLHSNSSANTFNLNNRFLEIPAGTELQFSIKFSGNLLNSTSEGDINKLSFVRDFYIYTTDDSDFKLGISTDGVKWNYNILAFRYDVTSHFETDTSGLLKYWRDTEIIYNFTE